MSALAASARGRAWATRGQSVEAVVLLHHDYDDQDDLDDQVPLFLFFSVFIECFFA